MSGLQPVKDIDLTLRQHVAAMERGSRLMLEVLQGRKPAPPNLVWLHGHMPDNWRRDDTSFTSERNARHAGQSLEKRHHAAGLRVASREPCPWCGVRQDIGCNHITPPAELTSADKVNQAWEAEIANAIARRLEGADAD